MPHKEPVTVAGIQLFKAAGPQSDWSWWLLMNSIPLLLSWDAIVAVTRCSLAN